MSYRSSTYAFALAALMMTTGGLRAAEDAKYPNWKDTSTLLNLVEEA